MIAQNTSSSLLHLGHVSAIQDTTLTLIAHVALSLKFLLTTVDAQTVLFLRPKFAMLPTIFKLLLLIQAIALASLAFSSLALPAIPAV